MKLLWIKFLLRFPLASVSLYGFQINHNFSDSVPVNRLLHNFKLVDLCSCGSELVNPCFHGSIQLLIVLLVLW